MGRQGLPEQIILSGIPSNTMEPAVVGAFREGIEGSLKSWFPVHRKTRCEIQQCDPIVTLLKLRIKTSSPVHE